MRDSDYQLPVWADDQCAKGGILQGARGLDTSAKAQSENSLPLLSRATCTGATTHRCVCLVAHACVCVVFTLELLTEVTLGLFLHSGDGTVLVCEEKLLELGHFILEHGHFILRRRRTQKPFMSIPVPSGPQAPPSSLDNC